MLSATLLLLLVLVLWSDHTFVHGQLVVNQCPQGVRPRREIRALSTQERQSFISAIQRLQRTGSPSRYDDFSQVHYDAREYAHGYSLFFPWHRYYIRLFETMLQEADANVMLPYWDWSLDSQAPGASVIFQDNYMGGNGREGDGCVVDGPFANLQTAFPQPNCLTRNFDMSPNGNNAFYSPEMIQNTISSTRDYAQFRNRIESIPHGNVHNGIGGIMVSMYSSNDPIFFLHHAMVDRIWAMWQQ
ncbi:hypothetical protein THASP1DRAFT_20022, partial [Thamnocephalis sphaerospora]